MSDFEQIVRAILDHYPEDAFEEAEVDGVRVASFAPIKPRKITDETVIWPYVGGECAM